MSKNFTFNTAPAIQMRRSKINGLSYGVTSSYSMGRVYPFYNEEVLPGDTLKVNSRIVSRLTSSFIKPIYGNLFVDVFYFFVPWRLVYDDFPCIFGENKNAAWKPLTPTYAPTAKEMTVSSKSISDYLEMPVGLFNGDINILYHRANALIWNDWFRDENYQDPVLVQTGDFNATAETLNNNEWSADNYTGKCAPISKYRDYFTSVLPEPQKGDAVDVGVVVAGTRTGPGGYADLPVYTRALGWSTIEPYPLTFQRAGGGELPDAPYALIGNPVGTPPIIQSELQINSDGSSTSSGSGLVPDNLYAYWPGGTMGTVNDLRQAFQLQKILERDALGTRYVEHIMNTFGVSNGDARMQRPELLNVARFSLNVQQVASTQEGGESGSLAQLGAYSLTSGKAGFSKAFTEYGCVIGYVAIRQFHSYSQGMPRRFTRKSRLDYYNPALAYLGFMPVYSTEIYSKAPIADIWGYQRPWAEYRHHQNAITGEMRSDAKNSLDVWHLGDEYANQPTMGGEFITETPNYLNRTITVDSSAQDQFIFDTWHDVEAIRVMPSNPMPGLIDHY